MGTSRRVPPRICCRAREYYATSMRPRLRRSATSTTSSAASTPAPPLSSLVQFFSPHYVPAHRSRQMFLMKGLSHEAIGSR